MTSRHHQRRPVLNPEGWPLLRRWVINKANDPRVIMWVLGVMALVGLMGGVLLVATGSGGMDLPAGLLLFAAINAGWSWMYMAVRLT